MSIAKMILVSAALLALAGCVVAPGPGYYGGGPAVYVDGPVGFCCGDGRGYRDERR
jgi:hypothetical protein